MSREQVLDLDDGLPVTPADREALRRLRNETPSWLDWDWRAIVALTDAEALARRPTATEAWTPFSLP